MNAVQVHLRAKFPRLVSYSRFVQLKRRVGVPLFAYLHARCLGACAGISFVDSTSLRVCHNRRIERHRVFKDCVQRGKTTMGWFFEFKLHVAINNLGELIDDTSR